MSVENNIEVITEAVKALNVRDWEAYGAAFSESLITHAPGLAEPARGRTARVQWVQSIVQAFPNGVIEITRTFGNGDLLCVELTFVIFVKHEYDRQVRSSGAQEFQAVGLRTGQGHFVRTHDSRLVVFEPKQPEKTVALVRAAIGRGEILT